MLKEERKIQYPTPNNKYSMRNGKKREKKKRRKKLSHAQAGKRGFNH
jgi:hypothetical protein